MKSKKKKKKITIKDIIRLIVLLVAFSVLLYPTFSSYLNEKNSSKVVSHYDKESVKLSKAGRAAGADRLEPAVPDRCRDGAAAARGGAGACHGAGSRGGRSCVLSGAGAALQKCAVPRRGAGAGDRLAAAAGRNRPAGRERLDGYPLHPGLWRQRPLRDRPSLKIN